MLEVEFAPHRASRRDWTCALSPTKLAIRTDRRLDAPPAAESGLQRPQIHPQGPRAGRLPPGFGRRSADRGLGHRARHPGRPAAGGVRGVPAARSGRARRAGPGARPVDRRAPRPRARPCRRVELAPRQGLGLLRHCAASERRRRKAATSAARRSWPWRSEPLRGLKVLAIDNEPRVLEGMRSAAEPMGLRGRHCARPQRGARGARGLRRRPTSSSPTIISTRATGSRRSALCARRSAATCPAILATADRSPEVRDEAARADIVILNKPLKPAPLERAAHPLQRDARGGGVGARAAHGAGAGGAAISER